MILTLDVEKREAGESTDTLRARGAVPAVFYGPKQEAISIAINAQNFERVYREAGQTSVITLKGIDGEKDSLIHDVQFHPVTGKPLHADFYVLEKGKKVTISIPLEFEGQAPAEKQGGVLVKAMHEIEIEVAPAELPKHLVVDLTKLENIGDHIVASQIALPKSATLLTHADEIVVSITEAAKEEAPQAAAPAAEAAPAEASAPSEEAAEQKAE